ncbi:MAG: Lpg1974 family pore-forming outer membrane protein [Gemmataceae bacterium]
MAYHWRLTFCLIVLGLCCSATLGQEPADAFPDVTAEHQPTDKDKADAAIVGMMPDLTFEEPFPGEPPPILEEELEELGPVAKHGFFAEVDLYVLRPFIANNAAFQTTVFRNTGNQERITEFDYDYGLSPALWVGWMYPDAHLGFQVRYFNFDQEANELRSSLNPTQAANMKIEVPPALPGVEQRMDLSQPQGLDRTVLSPRILVGRGNGQDILRFESDLTINTVEIEAIWKIRHNCFQLDMYGGVQYLHLEQTYFAQVSNQAASPAPAAAGLLSTELLLWNFLQTFNGAGPTIAFEGKYWVGPKGLAFYGAGRAALLVGTLTQELRVFESLVDPIGFIDVELEDLDTRDQTFDDLLPVLELEVGMEYGFPLGWGHAFLRAGLVSKTYFGANNATGLDTNLNLFGAQFGFGLEY